MQKIKLICVMCIVSINIDEAALRDMRPELDSTAAIRLWAQDIVDRRMQQMRMGDDETMGIEEARAMVHAAIHEEYAKA